MTGSPHRPSRVRQASGLAALRRRARALGRRLGPRTSATTTGVEAQNRQLISDYLRHHDVRKLQIGAGPTSLPGWLCTDLHPKRPDTARLDATTEFPLPDNSIDVIAAEHVIEHITYEQASSMLGECWRVLRPGGVLRVATPDLRNLVLAYLGQAGPEGEDYRNWTLERYLSRRPDDHAAFMVNHHVRAWGHTFLYDTSVLSALLSERAFTQVTQRSFGESPHPALRGVEQHGARGGERRKAAVRFETMIFEGSKPDTTH